ncbi:4-hydroxy-tetrahydrodipicolinate reductase [uncultured Cetobacterium sp.]|uniref:4-hydroxy-tetrahydrodipicolinate reductase n=1 Tax=uncultured Cetobacterium sp. TaxID=527638 RepID=UPI002601B4A2|nr:4-hydroxy-tetrahydrodipicolinate reductase [uncultured Cetobacterium sp.]
MKIVVHGRGTMGTIVKNELGENCFFVNEISEVPLEEENCVVIDFSHFSKIERMLKECKNRKYPVVIATTGYNGDILKNIIETSKEIPVLLSSNTSLGINLLNEMLKDITPKLEETFDIEIIEKHHNKKIDAPSGTAKTLLNTIENSLSEKYNVVYGREGICKRERAEIGVHAVRGGTVVGEHSILFLGDDEVIEITHKALSKRIFAAGAIECAKYLEKKEKNLYTMEDMFKDKGER